MTIRRATAADLPTATGIAVEAYREYVESIGIVPWPMSEDYAPRIARGEVWLLDEADGPIGEIVLEEEPDHLMIYSVCVLPAHRDRGAGRRLLAFAEERARALGVGEVRLYTNGLMARNVEIYKHLGFAETGRRPHPTRPGHTTVDMAKRVG